MAKISHLDVKTTSIFFISDILLSYIQNIVMWNNIF